MTVDVLVSFNYQMTQPRIHLKRVSVEAFLRSDWSLGYLGEFSDLLFDIGWPSPQWMASFPRQLVLDHIRKQIMHEHENKQANEPASSISP